MNPYAFFVGCPRSGTTLLGRIGDAHPELAVIHETRWIPRTFERRLGLTPEGFVTPELLAHLRGHPRFSRLELDVGPLERALTDGEDPATYADFVTAIFDLYGATRRKRRVGDKTPRYVRWIPTLTALWPEARFVHLVRDGRDVCLSVLDWRKGATNFSTWTDDPVSTVALWWEWHVLLGREAGAELGPRYHELRYESLVSDAEAECVALCEFLGLLYDSAMLRFHEGRMREGADAKKAWRPVTQGIRSWREEMTAEDVERFEAVAGPLLEELGYERAVPRPGAAAREQAERLRSRFAEEVRTRRRMFPVAWERAAA